MHWEPMTSGTVCNRRAFLSGLAGAAGAAMLFGCAHTGRTGPPPAKRTPNIVVILADDLGVGDINALNPDAKIPTPHLDALVREGMAFTDAHSASAVCTPSRYALLTGRYAWRTTLQRWVIAPYEPPLIAPNRLTLPGMLQGRGYHTACIGKWHLGWDWAGEGDGPEKQAVFDAPIAGGPTTRGFDYYFGTDVPNFPPFTFIENDRVVVQPTDRNTADDTIIVGYDGAPMAPGWRFDEILPTITDRAVSYVHERARAAEPFFLFFSMTSPHEPISPSARFRGASGIAPIADFIMETDWSAGRVIQALEEAGVAEDTLVVFTADNGASHYTGMDTLLEHGHQSSGPYRGRKAQIWEGGHRVPLVVRWPGVVAPGTRNDQLIGLNDLFATTAAIVDERLPDNAGEDSVNMLHVLTGGVGVPPRDAIVHHDTRGGFAIRQGPWKLVILVDYDTPPVFELYNLEDDPGETCNVRDAHPDIADRLLALLERYVEEGRSTAGPAQPNDTDAIDIRARARERWAPPR
ncbi:MAG: arylsulfatase [Candidatus Hydrogenedentes bacterium]|nr:arylsulfatase [Candidatus Hydrogenedentota bacterium]